MTSPSRRPLRRRAAWLVPAATAATVAVAAVLPSTASADPHPSLPTRTPAQLLAAVQTASVSTLSGTIVETARLGLPSLPGADDASALSVQTLISGTHTARVWFDGANKQRLALLGTLSESDLVHAGQDLWSYESGTLKVGHDQLPAEKAGAPEKADSKDLTTYTPEGTAQQALKAIDPSTLVTVDPTARVAGRKAYTLVLTPRTADSTVRKVLIAIDAARSIPLRVQVFGAATAPAFEIAFTDVSFKKPAASVFRFTPPKGATVSKSLLSGFPANAPDSSAEKAGTTKESASPSVLGSGWLSVVQLPAARDGSSPLGALTAGQGQHRAHRTSSLIGKLTTTLPNGDQLLRTALVNVLLAKDGRTFVGAVSPAVLEQAVAGQLR